ncbi:hypothetical protein Vau01_084140 [Virgisporangium aurantiacum]|uniref:Uncharacterized protein n=1 Tax=Virgisporangium aurantiacum TaxID=175570 RepID=A0A8J4E4D4_9ACTN|nr:hypothetical protein Vau01_084140 [Virgisporangium aurantiacum]
MHWVAPVAGVVFLGYLWLLLDGVMRDPDRRRPPLDGPALCLLASGLYVTLADPPGTVLPIVDRVLFGLLVLGSVVAALAWFRVVTLPRLRWRPPGPWTVLLFGLPELVTPVRWIVAGWRRTAPLRWCMSHPYTEQEFRRLGYRGPRVIATVARWFSPDQVRRLGWTATAVAAATEQMAFVSRQGWDAEAFVDAVRASGRDHADQLGNWGDLYRLGRHDPAEYLRYLAAGADIALALRYALGPDRVPYEVVLALTRRGVAKPWPHLYSLQREYRTHRTCYRGGWADIVAWVEYDETRPFTRALAARFTAWDDDTYFRRWREWAPVGERAPHPEPALWAAAGFTVDEALAVLDTGAEPDAEALRGLAALRRTA